MAEERKSPEALEEDIIKNPQLDDSSGFRLFGFEIKRAKNRRKLEQKILRQSLSIPDSDGADISIGPYGAHIRHHADFFGVSPDVSARQLIRMYRMAAEHPEADAAIEDIINESIAGNDKEGAPVRIVCDNVPGGKKVKDALTAEFGRILELLEFNERGYDIFRQWYVDGHLYYHVIVDQESPKANGIIALHQVDAMNIQKVRDVVLKGEAADGVDIVESVYEYYQYSSGVAGQEVKISADSIASITSGLLDPDRRVVHSYLHKALKPINQLRILEDALVIYRLARAPERRVFYIDVGNLPKNKAEEYLNRIMGRHRNIVNYNVETGEIVDRKQHMAMMEDYWLPRREGGRGTEIDTLSGGENLGEIEDIMYFQKKLYKSLNVPVNRLEQEMEFSLGRASEITRDELKFHKFVMRLRQQFSGLFFSLLEKQMLVKGLCTEDEWEVYREEDQLRLHHRRALRRDEGHRADAGAAESAERRRGLHRQLLLEGLRAQEHTAADAGGDQAHQGGCGEGEGGGARGRWRRRALPINTDTSKGK